MPAQVAAMRSITAAILLLSLLSHKNSGFPEGKPLGFDLDFTVYSKSHVSCVRNDRDASRPLTVRHDGSACVTLIPFFCPPAHRFPECFTLFRDWQTVEFCHAFAGRAPYPGDLTADIVAEAHAASTEGARHQIYHVTHFFFLSAKLQKPSQCLYASVLRHSSAYISTSSSFFSQASLLTWSMIL